MNRYHNLFQSNTQNSEPRWVTQCLEGFSVNEKEKGRQIKQSKIAKIFEKLRLHGKRGTRPTSSKAKEEEDFRNQAQMIYKDILETVDKQSTPAPGKGRLRIRGEKSNSASAPVSRNNSEASTITPKGILRNGRKNYPASELGGQQRRQPGSSLNSETRSMVSTTRMSLYHRGEAERGPEAKNRFLRPEYNTGYPGLR